MNNVSKYAQEFVENKCLRSIPIIDMHAHMGPVYGTSLPYSYVDEMIQVMERQNIETIVCSTHAALFNPVAANDDIEQTMKCYKGQILGYFAFNPNYADMMLPVINRVLQVEGYIGFKFLPEYHRTSLNQQAYREVLSFADKHRLTVLIHTWGGSAYNAPSHVQKILEDFPDITLIMGHSAPGECDSAIRLARDYDQAYLDLCDIHRHSGIIERMVDGAGADKVLFGTDIPWYDPYYCLGSILFAHISEQDQYKIIRGNALRILKKHDV